MASGSEVLFSCGDEGRQKERGSSGPMAAESERGGILCCSWPEPVSYTHLTLPTTPYV